MHRPILIAAAAALVLAGCGPAPGEGEQALKAAGPQPSLTVAAAAPAGPATAEGFIARVSAGNVFEMEAGQAALSKAADPRVKAFAQTMIDAHAASAADLQKAIAASGLAVMPVKAQTPAVIKRLDEVNLAKTEVFDKTYLRTQVIAHEQALEVLRRYAEAGEVKPLKDFAAKAAPAAAERQAMAERLAASL